jgi:hypothetical protein
LALLGALALVASLAVAGPAQAAKKPDLVIPGYALKGQRYAFQSERGRIIPHDITRNRGTARAGPSITRAYLLHGPNGQTMLPLASRAVPRLLPGKQNADDLWDPARLYNYPIGPYLVELCADVNRQVAESNETNNCVLIRNPVLETIKVFIIKRTWEGTLSGTATLGNIFERWKSTNAKLIFEGPIRVDEGFFRYSFAGPVTYTDTGSGSGCTYSGGDTQVFGPGGATPLDTVVFNYLLRRYSASASIDGTFYTIKITCGSVNGSTAGPVSFTFLSTGSRSFPFGATTISGSKQTSAQTFLWDFH